MLFELIGKGFLRDLNIFCSSVTHLNLGENKNVEILKVLNFKLPFYHMISQSSKLKVLQLWDVEFHVHNVVWDVKMKSVCFPQLRHVCLHYDPRDDMIQNSFLGSSQLVKVDELELGWLNEFFLMARFLEN